MESKKHEHTSFLTLTYDDRYLPDGDTLVKKHLQDFFKRLLYYRGMDYDTPSFRRYGIGEYGDRTFRPHYHAALFGISHKDIAEIHQAWTFCDPRFATLTPLVPERAAYLAGYVNKKMTKEDDPRLHGRAPEFALASKMGVGGIGASAMDDIAHMLLTDPHAADWLAEEGDVPLVLKTHGLTLPVGRYLRGKLREKVFPDDPAWFHTLERSFKQEKKFYQHMQDVRDGAKTLKELDKAFGLQRFSTPEERDENADQKLKNLVGKQQLTMNIGRKI